MEMIANGRFFCNQSRRMLHQDGVRYFFAIWRMQRAEQKNESLRPRKCGRRQRLFKYYLLAIIHHELFNLFVDIYFVDFLGVTFDFERALAHTEDDLRTTVVENE